MRAKWVTVSLGARFVHVLIEVRRSPSCEAVVFPPVRTGCFLQFVRCENLPPFVRVKCPPVGLIKRRTTTGAKLVMPPTKWGIVSAGKICHDFVSCLNTMPAEEHQVSSETLLITRKAKVDSH